jgi:hypothetical protein
VSPIRPFKGHGLLTRWKRVRAALERIWPGEYQDELTAVEEVITQLGIADARSDTFRYPVDLSGKSNLPPALERFDLLHFGAEMETFAHWVGGCADALAARQDSDDEARRIEREFAPADDDF